MFSLVLFSLSLSLSLPSLDRAVLIVDVNVSYTTLTFTRDTHTVTHSTTLNYYMKYLCIFVQFHSNLVHFLVSLSSPLLSFRVTRFHLFASNTLLHLLPHTFAHCVSHTFHSLTRIYLSIALTSLHFSLIPVCK